MKLLASLLLALVTASSALAAPIPFGACAIMKPACVQRPCCKHTESAVPQVRARMACCDTGKSMERATPPLATRQEGSVFIGLPSAPTIIATVVVVRDARTDDVLPPPRGPPLYLLHRSLLL